MNHRIRKVDLPSRSVTTIAGDGKRMFVCDGTGVKCSIRYPQHLVFDRSPNVKPNSVLLITSERAIRRFDTETGVVTTLKLSRLTASGTGIDPWSLAHTPSGHMIIGCADTHSLYLVDPSGAVLTVAGTAKSGFMDGTAATAQFSGICSVVVIERERCAYVCDCYNHRIRRITLPPQLFASSEAPAPAPVSAEVSVLCAASDHSACEAANAKLAADFKRRETKLLSDLQTAQAKAAESESNRKLSESKLSAELASEKVLTAELRLKLSSAEAKAKDLSAALAVALKDVKSAAPDLDDLTKAVYTLKAIQKSDDAWDDINKEFKACRFGHSFVSPSVHLFLTLCSVLFPAGLLVRYRYRR